MLIKYKDNDDIKMHPTINGKKADEKYSLCKLSIFFALASEIAIVRAFPRIDEAAIIHINNGTIIK